MASNNEYKRYFIILQEDDKGYGMSPGKIPTGYVKIEVKSSKVKLNAFIQNVKVEDRAEYRLILVASGKKMAVDVGKIIMDSTGRGELSSEIESDNVLKSGLSISDFTVAAVACGGTLPLSGYTGREKLEWKGKYEVVNRPKQQEPVRIDKKIKIEEVVPEVIQPAPVPVVEKPIIPEPVVIQPPAPPEMPVEIPAEPAPVHVHVPEPLPMPMPEPTPEPEMEYTYVHESKVEVEIDIPQCPPMAPIEEPCEIEEKEELDDIKQYYYDESSDSSESDDSDDEERPKHHHEEHEEAPYYNSDMYRMLGRLIRKLRKYEPFEDERGIDWFKVGESIYEINNIAVPYMGYMVPMGYPFVTEGCSMMLDRKDYILGVKYDKREDDDDRRRINYLLFGVPAVYSKRNEQYYRARGFTEFKQHKSKGYGYFIMCLSLKNGMLCHID